MHAAPATARRGRVTALTVVLASLLLLAPTLVPGDAARGSSHDGELFAQLELPRGQITFDLQPGTLHFFDAENSPFIVQVIDGCAVNGYYWVLGAGLAAEAAPLTVIDGRSGQSERIILPAFDSDEPVPSVIETEALRLCRTVQSGGLPALSGIGTYTPANDRCVAVDDAIELLSEGRDDAYRTLIRGGTEEHRIIRRSPIVAVDDSNAYDELHLLTEGRTPRLVEGVVFSGDAGMLPRRPVLERQLKDIPRSRVRRAFETAKAGRVPRAIIQDLKLKGVRCVHHVALDMQTLGADAFLAEAGWIEEGGAPIAPPSLVEDRFEVSVATAGSEPVPLTLRGPLEGSEQAGQLWRYEGDGVLTQVVDACALSGTFWTIAGAVTDEPLQLTVTDRTTGASTTQLLWTETPKAPWVADTASLTACP